MHLLGLAETPGEIAGLLDLRRRELGLTSLAVDDVAGTQSGYASKLFCGKKRLGDMSLPALLGALGARLVVVADDAWLPAVTRREMGSANSAHWRRPPPLLSPPDSVFARIPGASVMVLPPVPEDGLPPMRLIA